MRTAAVALLSFLLGGCASAARTSEPRLPSAPAPTAEHTTKAARAVGDSDGAPSEEALSEYLEAAGASLLLAQQYGSVAEGGGDGSLGAFEPEVVHRAKIDMARAALVEENLNKERVDLAEELQRELAALQASQASKSRGRPAGARKKQP